MMLDESDIRWAKEQRRYRDELRHCAWYTKQLAQQMNSSGGVVIQCSMLEVQRQRGRIHNAASKMRFRVRTTVSMVQDVPFPVARIVGEVVDYR